ncbi:MAG TPA: asparagine synthase (glutamine-hydrolyzing) [Gammaproteobacteria bacterium]|nr:asparagine synthase (glutamine-hydrolyzing) [Gammaproteobacteria bacterium]
MCGIVGLVDLGGESVGGVLQHAVGAMADALRHRGPDDAGTWVDASAGVALAHRRLSILDLSAAGHQPMVSADGRRVLVFNGEIYNFRALRSELEKHGIGFRGHSDTEVLLAAIGLWGMEEALAKSNGMFAFALWDRRERTLSLARDRVGEKPLYYGWVGGDFVFASELKALRVHPRWRGEVDRGALTLLLRHNYIPAPYSIYQGIHKLPPGHWLTLSPSARDEQGGVQVVPYWSAREVAESGARDPFRGTTQEAADGLETLLRDAVRLRLEADVPVGAFLSGGIDSSITVALMQQESRSPVRTFSIGFHESEYNEAHHAKAVAAHLGTEHTELYVTAREAMEVIPRLPEIFDEPFADSSQIPTFLVSEMTRRHVTVSLSGDGGDELFGGYNRYFLGRSLWNKIGWMPARARAVVASGIRAVGPARTGRVLNAVQAALPARLRIQNPGDKLDKLAKILAEPNPDALYHGLVSHWQRPAEVVIGGHEPPTAVTDRDGWARLPDFTERMMYLDLVSYLPDDILVKVDRASMAVSLESRIPLLDPRLIEFAWRLPLALKVRNGEGKWLLRQVLYRHVPRALIDRPKTGFGVPIDTWLRGPLRDWCEALLDPARLAREGYFEPEPIRAKWEEHLSGRRNWHYYLWDVLMFQAWLEHAAA